MKSATETNISLDNFVDSKPSNELSYHNLSLLEYDPTYKIEYNVFNVLSDYINDLKKLSVEVELTKNEYYTYRYRPKLLANFLYGNGELYFIILWVNDIWSVKDFDFRKLKLISRNDLSDFLSKVNASERKFIRSYNESALASY